MTSISFNPGSIASAVAPATTSNLFSSGTSPIEETAQLFLNNQAGFMGYQSLSQTLAVSNVGDSVAQQTNISPSPAFNLTQPTALAKPTWGRIPRGGRRNQFVNSATLATQNITTRAVAYTLSFTGTGTITLSGTSTAGPLVGTGSGRVSLTFTPTAGTLTCTVTGTCTNAQIEIGSSVTAYQNVGAVYDVTEEGVPSIPMLYFNGSANYLLTGVSSFGTASFFADSSQKWWVAFVWSTFNYGGSPANTILCKGGATEAARDIHIRIAASGACSTVIRGAANVAPAVNYADGLLHIGMIVWDGSVCTQYLDTAAGEILTVGAAAQSSEHILIAARTESSPAAFMNGFCEILGFGDGAISTQQTSNYISWMNQFYRGV